MSKKLLFNLNREVAQDYTYVKYIGNHIAAANTVEKPIKNAFLKGQTLDTLVNFGEISISNASEDFEFLVTPTLNYNYYLELTIIECKPIAGAGDYIEARGITATGAIEPLHRLTQEFKVGTYILPITFSKECSKFRLACSFAMKATARLTGELISIRMPSLEISGKNLFDKTKEQINITIDLKSGAVNYVTNDRNTSDFIRVNQSTSYICSVTMTRIAYYNENKKFLSSLTNTKTLTTPKNAAYLRFSYNNATSSDIQLEHGAQATQYEPYKTSILTVNEDVTLRANGSVYDELDLLTGKLTQRIDEDGEVLAKEVIKTVDLSILDQNGNKVSSISSFNDTTHITASSETIPPIFEGYLATKEG